MAIYKKGKHLSRQAIKQEIKQIRGWSESKYQKEINIIRKGIQIYGRKEQANELLYKETIAIKNYGNDYQPTQYIKDIRRYGKVRRSKRTILTKAGQIRQIKKESVQARFGAFIRSNSKAREIAKQIKDPYKREKALTDYANKLHAKIDEQEKVWQNEAIPFSSQTYGSDTSIDFDIDNYL